MGSYDYYSVEDLKAALASREQHLAENQARLEGAQDDPGYAAFVQKRINTQQNDIDEIKTQLNARN